VLLILAVLFGLLALGSAAIARRLTRRLETLEEGVTGLGAGRLATRVPVEGHDEIARLAERFNVAAERIERLVEAQRRVLLSASHELRSPLARVRMALELIRDQGGAEVAARVADAVTDVDELDALVGDLLLAGRIEAEHQLTAMSSVDLAPLLGEEGGRAGARLALAPCVVTGDPRLLRRLIRNLLDNAVRHGGGDVEAGVGPIEGGGARLWVADRGPGIPAADRERIFEPFYRGARAPADASGVGLGLALVRQIAERHGGGAVCREREGGGTLFEVTLPAAPPAGS
jgi:signal transduction histidine kinase